jgi:hypothetical protein
MLKIISGETLILIFLPWKVTYQVHACVNCCFRFLESSFAMFSLLPYLRMGALAEAGSAAVAAATVRLSRCHGNRANWQYRLIFLIIISLFFKEKKA